MREATTKPTTPRAAENQTGDEAAAGIQALMRKARQRHVEDGQGQHEAANDKRDRR